MYNHVQVYDGMHNSFSVKPVMSGKPIDNAHLTVILLLLCCYDLHCLHTLYNYSNSMALVDSCCKYPLQH